MGFNYGRETKKFEARWRILQETYEAAGMSETDIQEMRVFDWEELKGARRFWAHNQSLEGFVFSDGDAAGEDRSPLLKRYSERFSVRQPEISAWGRYDWVEDIDTPELARRLKALPMTTLELLTQLLADGMSRAEASRKMGVSRAAVTQRINRVKKALSEIRRQPDWDREWPCLDTARTKPVSKFTTP
jgi:DNA-directed RNA polymerase specialized sigma subunit